MSDFLQFQHLSKDNPKRRVVTFPLVDTPFSVLFCVVSPKIQEGHVAMLIHECSLFSWPTLKKAIAHEYETTLKVKCQQLLRVARRLFTQVASLETLLQMAADQARQLTRAEYCNVLLVDVDKMELVDSSSPVKEEGTERRFPMDIGITGEVIKSGTIVNARSAKEHPAFDPKIDSLPNITCRYSSSILTVASRLSFRSQKCPLLPNSGTIRDHRCGSADQQGGGPLLRRHG